MAEEEAREKDSAAATQAYVLDGDVAEEAAHTDDQENEKQRLRMKLAYNPL